MKKIHLSLFCKLLFLMSFIMVVIDAIGQIGIPNSSPITQDFDAMAATTNLPTNWRMAASTSSPMWSLASVTVTQQASTGSPANGGTYNWGQNGAAERAVGAMTSGSFASPNNLLVWLQNTGSTNITQLTISYDAERYRRNSAAASVEFFYSLNGTSWTEVMAGNISSSSFPTGSSNYYFAAPDPIINVSSFNITSLSINPGGNIYIRWNINTTGSNSQGIGIDNVSISATFLPTCTSPTTQATNFSATNITTTQMDVNWVRGATPGDNVLVVARQGSAVNVDPTNGTSYSADAAFGDGDEIGTGNYVVYNGVGTSVTVTNLLASTTYHFAIYEYNNLDVCYNLTQLVGNATTQDMPCSEPANQPINLMLTPSYTYITGSFTAAIGSPSANGYLILRGTSPNPGCLPSDGTIYTVGQTIGSCNVVYSGSNTTFNNTGLTSGTNYYYFIFSYNNSTGTTLCPNYNTTDALQGNTMTLTAPNVAINEVDSDTPGSDTEEFVELYGTQNISLDGLVLVFYNGSNDLSYYSLDLDGYFLNSSGFFLIGNSAVTPAPNVTFSDNILQNGADAVALYVGSAADFPINTPVTSTNLISALVYGTNDPADAGLINGLNQLINGQIDENGGGSSEDQSNQLIGGIWQQASPTPGAPNSLLPIELHNFAVAKSETNIILSWQTASETNNSHFSIEKSADGETYREIAQVLGQGTSYETHKYEYIDESPYPGLNYYRLKQVDFDGRYSYSPVVSVDFQAKGKMGIYPNPFSNEITLTFTEEAAQDRQILLFDQTGRLVQTIELMGDELSLDLNTNNLSSGTYILKVQSGQNVEMHRLIKM